MSELYQNEDEIPTADHDEDLAAEDGGSRYLSWMKWSFIGYVLLAGVAAVLGISGLYVAVAPPLLGLTFMVLVALDARTISTWGPTKYLYAVGSFFVPLALVYYFRRGMKTV